ncbi:MAG: methyl-accepting chemotaxis protein [Planctomycetota bacterium]
MNAMAGGSAAPDLEAEKMQLTQDKLLASYRKLWVGNDRFFAIALLVQWVALVAQALVISPKTWIGAESATHAHVWAALLLGGLVCGPAAAIGWFKRGDTIARLTMTAAQALVVAMLIHFGGGRIEWHFSVFVTLAVLAMYRDPKVLIVATGIIAADHLLRGLFWPQSIYGYVGAGRWLWLEHAVWVVIEVGLLMAGLRLSAKEMRLIAEREAELELVGQVGIARSVDGMVRDIKQIETTGDLTQKVDPRFDGVTVELAEAMNGFIETLRGIIQDVSGAAHEASSSSVSISAGAQEMAETADSMLQQAKAISGNAAQASSVAEQGSQVVGETIQNLHVIGEGVKRGGELVSQLDGRSQQIGSLVSVIQDIADQTNLLALNAAIESARAGEHGRGFAVVADEVRKLADRTASVTDEIQQAILEINTETQRAREAMETNSQKAEECVDQSATAGEILETILRRSQEVDREIQKLSAGFSEVGDASSSMSESVTQLAERNEQLTRLAEQFTTA